MKAACSLCGSGTFSLNSHGRSILSGFNREQEQAADFSWKQTESFGSGYVSITEPFFSSHSFITSWALPTESIRSDSSFALHHVTAYCCWPLQMSISSLKECCAFSLQCLKLLKVQERIKALRKKKTTFTVKLWSCEHWPQESHHGSFHPSVHPQPTAAQWQVTLVQHVSPESSWEWPITTRPPRRSAVPRTSWRG